MTPLDAALEYAARGWPVCPWATNGSRKYPLTKRGHLDATLDPDVITGWWRGSPDAIPSIATGERSGVVGLDIDIRPDGSGFDTLDDLLDELGVPPFHPQTPTTHTPQGGCAVLFRWPGRFIKTSAGQLGKHLDIRGDGGSLLLPPGPGRRWDPYLGPDTPLARMPDWMVIAEPERMTAARPVRPATGLSPYAEAALDSACRRIAAAPRGKQEATLNGECFAIGTLAGAGAIPPDFARRALAWAAHQMPSYDRRRPWSSSEVERKVDHAFSDGMRQPRAAANG